MNSARTNTSPIQYIVLIKLHEATTQIELLDI